MQQNVFGVFELNKLNRSDLIFGFEVYCKIWNIFKLLRTQPKYGPL